MDTRVAHWKGCEFWNANIPTRRPNLKKDAIPSVNLPPSTVINTYVERAKKIAIERARRRKALELKKQAAPLVETPLVEAPSLPEEECQLEGEADSGLLPDIPPLKLDKSVQIYSGDLASPILVNVASFTEKQLNTATGLTSFQLLYQIVADVGPRLTKRKIDATHQIVLTFQIIKQNQSYSYAAILFGCTPNLVKIIFKEVITALADHFQNFIFWPTKEHVLENMPNCFKHFQNVRVVFDCTEIVVDKPSCLNCRVRTYSNYCSDHTVKLLVGCSPGGVICFVSQAYGGRTSDSCIIRQSNVLHMLEPLVDAVMVDKGFKIEDVCKENHITLFRPPFLKQKTQLAENQVSMTKVIASARVHIERLNQRLKIFKLLKGPLPWHMMDVIDDILITICGLVNITNPILSDDKYM
nr:uncharacterized protein LOC110282842 [Parasteatoda tepidariorum]